MAAPLPAPSTASAGSPTQLWRVPFLGRRALCRRTFQMMGAHLLEQKETPARVDVRTEAPGDEARQGSIGWGVRAFLQDHDDT